MNHDSKANSKDPTRTEAEMILQASKSFYTILYYSLSVFSAFLILCHLDPHRLATPGL